MSFALDPRLAADTLVVGDLALSRLLLMNDARFPWLILVPRRVGLVELTDLDARERGMAMEEIAAASLALAALPEVQKINVGALGNIVRQLHIHVIGRRTGDAAWPGPAWGSGAALAYEPAARGARLNWLAEKLSIRPARDEP